MRKRNRIIGLGAAFALLLSQSVHAEVLITPLDPGSTSQEASQAAGSGQTESQASESGRTESQAAEPGQAESQTAESGQTQAGMSTLFAGSYSTTSPVILYTGGSSGAETGSARPGRTDGHVGPGYTDADSSGTGSFGTGGPGAAGSGTGSSAGPGYEAETQATEAAVSMAEVAEPELSARAGILYDVTHGQVLYEKNADEKLYPASITKLMTALLVLENAGMDETVTFSETAVTSLESGAVTLQLTAGDQVSVKDCLYGLLLKSANEVANGLAEHVGGSISGFADMMNAKAAALGCTGTNFVNPNGLNDPNHYTTARDMAKIAAAAFANPVLCEIASTVSYEFPATKAAAARTITPGHKMLYASDSRYYEGIIGGKTGYTSLAGNTLVTCVEKDGVRLAAVVLKANGSHYTDTKAMLDFGYELNAAGALNGLSGSGLTMGYHRWVRNGSTWSFELADGARLADCLASIDGKEYAFDAQGIMAVGWANCGGDWYFFEESGAMVKNEWQQDAGKWFYLGSDGRMAKDTVVDGQYHVGSDGAWIQ